MMLEINNNGYIKTKFDNKLALIINEHPHSGTTAICLGLGLDETNVGVGLVFENINSHERFFVFEPKHLTWVNNKK